MSFIIYDIETVPTSGVEDVPAPTPEKPDPFPPLACHVPVVIGTMEFSQDYMPVAAKAISCIGDKGDVTEPAMLGEFSDLVQGTRGTLVSWNGRRFDMPVIVLRCFRWGIPLPWYYQSKDMRYRFSDAGHFDVMDYVSDFGAATNIGLGSMAKLIGLPGKVGVDGSNVMQLWEADKIEDIEHYCMTDVMQLAFIWLRAQLIRGIIPLEQYQASAEALLRRCRMNEARYGAVLNGTDLGRLLLKEVPSGSDEGETEVPPPGEDAGVDRGAGEAAAAGGRGRDGAREQDG